MGKITITVSALLLAAVGFVAFGYAPATCACIDPPTALAFTAGMDGADVPLDFAPASLEAGLNRTLQGRRVVFGEYPFSDQNHCVETDPGTIVCRVPIDRSPLMAREHRVTYEHVGGQFRNARVALVRWPGP